MIRSTKAKKSRVAWDIKFSIAIMFIFVSLLLTSSCKEPTEPPSLAGKYATLVEENAKLRVSLQEAEAEARALNTSKTRAEHERNEWRDRAGDLEQLVDRLTPEDLPAFRPEDLDENDLVLRRVFSLRTGQCFDHSGSSSCLFAKLDESDGGGYVLYKANRVFPNEDVFPRLYNAYGERLDLVTEEAGREIHAWELENPHHPMRLGSY